MRSIKEKLKETLEDKTKSKVLFLFIFIFFFTLGFLFYKDATPYHFEENGKTYRLACSHYEGSEKKWCLFETPGAECASSCSSESEVQRFYESPNPVKTAVGIGAGVVGIFLAILLFAGMGLM